MRHASELAACWAFLIRSGVMESRLSRARSATAKTLRVGLAGSGDAMPTTTWSPRRWCMPATS